MVSYHNIFQLKVVQFYPPLRGNPYHPPLPLSQGKGKGQPDTLMLARREGEVIDPTHLQPNIGEGEWLAPCFGPFNPGRPTAPTVEVSKWASAPIWMARKIPPPLEFDPRTVQHIANRYTENTVAAATP